MFAFGREMERKIDRGERERLSDGGREREHNV